MQLELFHAGRQRQRLPETLVVNGQPVPIWFVRNRRARRYVLRVSADGTIRATLPAFGSKREARAFAERSRDWIARHLQQRRSRPPQPVSWEHGAEILYRGEKVVLNVAPNHQGLIVTFADQSIIATASADLRSAIERHLWQLARLELTARALELGDQCRVEIRRITIRNQRTRWGSCSRHGALSLNWRLIQTPPFVRDYVILHELMHRREMNHSHRFWQRLARVCPHQVEARAWLRQHRGLLR